MDAVPHSVLSLSFHLFHYSSLTKSSNSISNRVLIIPFNRIRIDVAPKVGHDIS